MSPRLTPIRARELIVVLESYGFEQVRQRGSHIRLVHPDGRRTTVPVHEREEIGRSLLRHILKQAAIDRDEFLERLRSD